MVLKINKDYYPEITSYDGKDKLIIETKYFKFKWFTDFDEWYIRIELLNKWWWKFSRISYARGTFN